MRPITVSAALGFFAVIGAAISPDCQAAPLPRGAQHHATSAQPTQTLVVVTHKHRWWTFRHYGPNPITQPALAEISPTRVIGVDYNSPTVGSPLFYDPGNMNWEEAPPFGLW